MVISNKKIIKVSVDDKITALTINVEKQRYKGVGEVIFIMNGFSIFGQPDNIDDAKEIILGALVSNGYLEKNIKFIE